MKKIAVFFAVITLGGCVTTPVETPISRYTVKRFSAPLDKEFVVNTGEALFVEGEYIEGESINVPTELHMFIPGAMFIPFPITIKYGELKMTNVENSFKYYCAAHDRATASFSSRSVISEGDCVGVRVPIMGGRPEWVVDNSIHNQTKTIWTKSMTDEEAAVYVAKSADYPFRIKSLRRIVFDGKSGGQLHFTLEEVSADAKNIKQFNFDFPGQSTLIGIKGNEFFAVHADNTKLVYRWTKISGGQF